MTVSSSEFAYSPKTTFFSKLPIENKTLSKPPNWIFIHLCKGYLNFKAYENSYSCMIKEPRDFSNKSFHALK